MTPERILVPVDIRNCPLEIFEQVNGFAKRPEATVILLHVVNLNIMAGGSVYDEIGREAEWHLERLASLHVHPAASVLIHVRFGNPEEQILAEARTEAVDLILLPSFGPSFWNRLGALWKRAGGSVISSLGEKLIRQAHCEVFVVLAKTRFNCEEAWGNPEPRDQQFEEAGWAGIRSAA